MEINLEVNFNKKRNPRIAVHALPVTDNLFLNGIVSFSEKKIVTKICNRKEINLMCASCLQVDQYFKISPPKNL